MASNQWPCQAPIEISAAHILQVPRRKAAPAGHPPSATWRICADLISPWLCRTLRTAWHSTSIEVPQAWTNVDLALVPKPEKSGREPKDYRPIGLACPLGKKMLGAILQPHVTAIIHQIRVFPQFAYQQGRSQIAALRRVFQHCASARKSLQLHARNLHHRFEGNKPSPLFGALMVTLDLTQAFDRMPRHCLYSGLCRLGVHTDIVHLLMAWHSNIHYRIHHNQDSRSFKATRGIRQGCSVAPLLWLVFSHEVSCALAEKVGMDTIARDLTIFADDYLVADTFSSIAELEALLDVILALFRTLEAYGMEVSDQKSKAVLALRGTLSNSVRRRFIRNNLAGEGKVLCLHTKGGALRIPLTQQITYLGTQISYHHFERQTLESRLAKAEIAYNRLGSVLKGRHHLSTGQRVSLWRSCVWATAQYGLTACGLTRAGLHVLEVAMLRQLPVHLTHSTNLQVCQDAGVPLPHQMLRQLTQTESNKHWCLSEDPFVCSPLSDWWQHVFGSLEPAGSDQLARTV